MSASFADSNILLYLANADPLKAATARRLLAGRLTISVQVLNETAVVMRGKWKKPWDEVETLLVLIRKFATVVPIDVATHEGGLAIAKAYGLSVYDSMIVAAALRAKCETLYSEDMRDGLLVAGRLRIVNPFAV